MSSVKLVSDTMAAPPVVLRPEHVPNDMICSICMTLPFDPVMTPCEHMFCRGCISQAIDGVRQCPIDRMACTAQQLQPVGGFVLRMWSSIQVKCGNHDEGCAWTGSIGDYAAHANLCNKILGVGVGDRGNHGDAALREKVSEMERKNARLREELDSVKFTKAALEQEVIRLELALHLGRRGDDVGTFRGGYDYRPEDVVELSQLVSRHLETIPSEIDGNRIYNCVQECYRALDRIHLHSEDAAQYRREVKMLLATCEASGDWFSERQLDNFERWLREEPW